MLELYSEVAAILTLCAGLSPWAGCALGSSRAEGRHRRVLRWRNAKQQTFQKWPGKERESEAGDRDGAGEARGFAHPANGRDAMCEIEQDLQEGADIIMVKPALAYLDLIRQARDRFDVPIAAYR